jgi:hypothetical protein
MAVPADAHSVGTAQRPDRGRPDGAAHSHAEPIRGWVGRWESEQGTAAKPQKGAQSCPVRPTGATHAERATSSCVGPQICAKSSTRIVYVGRANSRGGACEGLRRRSERRKAMPFWSSRLGYVLFMLP